MGLLLNANASVTGSANPLAGRTLAVRSPAKVNLTLSVHGRRSDGFHELTSVVMGVELSDELSCRAASTSAGLSCNDPALINRDNLVLRAAAALEAHVGRSLPAAFQLSKRIPVGAGMGGGSGDAAAALRLLDRAYALGLGESALAEIGSAVGSDVPLFMALPAARITGRGEKVARRPLAWRGWVLVVFAGEFVSTPRVYASRSPGDHDPARLGRHDAVERAASAGELGALLFNELEPAVFRVSHRVQEVFAELNHPDLAPFRVSGAGSALFRLFDHQDDARRVAEFVAARGIGSGSAIVAGPVGMSPIRVEE